MHTTTLITRGDIARIVTSVGLDALMDATIERLRAHWSSPRHDSQPVRAGFRHASGGAAGVLEWMPYSDGDRGVTIKVVSYSPRNCQQYGLPTIMATASTYDLFTGRLLAVTDGVFLTALRTGAASAVASSVLARPDSRVLGIVGGGAQAVTQVHALGRVFALERVLVYDSDPHVLDSFPGRVRFSDCPVEKASLPDVEEGADILVTATSVGIGQGPVIDGRRLRSHVHINAIGSDLPGKTELPLALLEGALVCPDFRDQAVMEGECQQLDANQIGPELHEVIRAGGAYASFRDRLTVFDSTGVSSEDHVAMQVLLEHARDLGIGHRVLLEHIPDDVHNPYDGLLERDIAVAVAHT